MGFGVKVVVVAAVVVLVVTCVVVNTVIVAVVISALTSVTVLAVAVGIQSFFPFFVYQNIQEENSVKRNKF